ncbi:hypothetical protein ABH945_006086 [Paraburkholderia sp. GAS333]
MRTTRRSTPVALEYPLGWITLMLDEIGGDPLLKTGNCDD